jgi:hypothetical protein
MQGVLGRMNIEYGTFVVSVGILLVNIIFYAKKWKSGQKG